MTLRKYFQQFDTNKRAFARSCGFESQNLYNIIDGKKDMLLSKALRICKRTGWKLQPIDLLDKKIWDKTIPLKERKNEK